MIIIHIKTCWQVIVTTVNELQLALESPHIICYLFNSLQRIYAFIDPLNIPYDKKENNYLTTAFPFSP